MPSGQATTIQPGKGTMAELESADHDTSDPNPDAAMTRSEQVRAGTEKVTAGRARLRRWVETEDANLKVSVTKETARLDIEPITDADRSSALDAPDISEEEHVVTLTEERPVVARPVEETGPVERVRLTKETVEAVGRVSEQVRKERIATDGDVELTQGR